jgi:hypothetical protein
MIKPLDISLSQSYMAKEISDTWDRWKRAKAGWEEERRELNNYIFATDTKTTTNNKLQWKNSTTMPKLCQLRDNLHANYMAALFPNENWLSWEGGDEFSVVKEKARAIEAYMKNKLDMSNFKALVSQFIYDYIDSGNVIGGVEWVNETKYDEITGEVIQGYIGPKAYRVSMYDHVFDPSANSYRESPKVTRSLISTGQLAAKLEDLEYSHDPIKESLYFRNQITQYGTEDVGKDEAYRLEGFGSLYQYYTSGYVELLDCEGDFYDVDSGELLKDRIITVLDRRTVIRNIQNPSWFMNNNKFHCGWRLRPDNLIAMGPLDNLVGMQYRMDHLENAKADGIDQFIHPYKKIRGYVEDFDDVPNERIYVGDDGDVEFLRPPLDQLLAYNGELVFYQNQMEEMAGAPKQAMGIRTPGEKTAYEVQTLENASGRIFQNKIEYFESTFLNPLLNAMLELARRNIQGSDVIRVMDDDLGVIEFLNVTKEDITAAGKLRPVGASHFAAKAKLVQEITQWLNSPVGADPAVSVHISGFKIAKLMEDSLDLDKYGLVQDNIRVLEQAETQKLMNAAVEQIEVDNITPTE